MLASDEQALGIKPLTNDLMDFAILLDMGIAAPKTQRQRYPCLVEANHNTRTLFESPQRKYACLCAPAFIPCLKGIWRNPLNKSFVNQVPFVASIYHY
jgi:hypothetical protein